jgi:hypothetical protein
MTPEIRNAIVIARSGDYFGIMRTTFLTFLGIAAILAFAPGGLSLPLAALVIAITAYGILAGGTALDDIIALRDDMDDKMAATAYGKGVASRNIPALKMISAVLVGLIGLAELIAALT